MTNRFEAFTIQELQSIRMGMSDGDLDKELWEAVDSKLAVAAKKNNGLPVYGGKLTPEETNALR